MLVFQMVLVPELTTGTGSAPSAIFAVDSCWLFMAHE